MEDEAIALLESGKLRRAERILKRLLANKSVDISLLKGEEKGRLLFLTVGRDSVEPCWIFRGNIGARQNLALPKEDGISVCQERYIR